MAIREIRWQNFRAFRDTGWLEICPITVLIGSNNSGKSSILYPLLLLKQTLDSKRAQSALVLRGELLNAGSFSDIVHDHNPAVDFTFGIRFHRRPSPEAEAGELGSNPPSVCEFTFKAEKAPGVISLQRYAARDQFDRIMIEREKVDTRMYSLSSIQDWAQGNGTGDSADDLSDDAARKAISEASPYHFLFDADSIFSQAVEAIQGPLPSVSNSSAEAREEGKPLRESEELSFSPFVATYASTVTFVEQHITNDLDEVSRVIQCPDPLWELYDSFGAPE